MPSALEIGFALDRRWHWMRGEMEQSKELALVAIAEIFAEAAVPYAIIGGVALQIRQPEPRTTLDIDLALLDRATIPRAALTAAGFRQTGSYTHSDNWLGPGATPVQLTDDPALHEAVRRAELIPIGALNLRVLCAIDLVHAKLRAADSAHRRTKRLQDLVDAESLLDLDPSLRAALSPAELALLSQLPR